MGPLQVKLKAAWPENAKPAEEAGFFSANVKVIKFAPWRLPALEKAAKQRL
jgi:hypothetical protein